MSVLPQEIIEELDGSVFVGAASFLRSYICRCESALAVIICRTFGELGSRGSLGGRG